MTGQGSAAALAALLMGVVHDLVLQCLVGGMAIEEMPQEVVEWMPERFPKQVVVGLRPLIRSKLWCATAVGTYISSGWAWLILSVKLFSRRLNGEMASLYSFNAIWALFRCLTGTRS